MWKMEIDIKFIFINSEYLLLTLDLSVYTQLYNTSGIVNFKVLTFIFNYVFVLYVLFTNLCNFKIAEQLVGNISACEIFISKKRFY
jgi:hypothetical protein